MKAFKTLFLYTILLCFLSTHTFAATLDGGPPPFGSSVQEIRADDALEKAELYKRATIRSNTVSVPVSNNRIVIASSDVPVTALSDGISLDFVAIANNSGAATLKLDSTPETAFTNVDGSALVGGEIISGRQYHVRYYFTSTQWRLATSLPGTAITNNPSGNIVSGDTQSAINELDTNKAGLSLANVYTADQTVTDARFAVKSSSSGSVGQSIIGYRINTRDNTGILGNGIDLKLKISDPTPGAVSAYAGITTNQAGTSADRVYVGAGVYTPNATGGDLGVDTFNAINYFVNGVNLTAIYQSISSNLTCYAALTTGMVTNTGVGTCASRTLTGTANELTVTNGNGASGNPTISIPAAVTFTGKTVTGGTYTGAAYNGTLGATTPSTVKATSYALTNLVSNTTAPTVSGFCTSPSVPSNNGTAAFTINVGTSCAASTGTITLPAATTGWVCAVFDVTTPATNTINMTGGTTTTVTVTNYSRTTGVAANFTSSDVLRVMCSAY